MNMEWTEDNDIQLAKEVLGSEPSLQAFVYVGPITSRNAPINAMRGSAWGGCLCWPWGRAFDWSCSPMGRDN